MTSTSATGTLLEGRKIAEAIRADLRPRFAALAKKWKRPAGLATLVFGSDHAQELFARSQKKVAEELGVSHRIVPVSERVSQRDLISKIQSLNRDPAVNGILVQMPLPVELEINAVMNAMDPKRDVEGQHTDNLGLLVLKRARLAPCTALACMEMLRAARIPLRGKEAVVVGSSKIVGRPLSLMLLDELATTTVCHIATSEAGKLKEHVERADILIAAVGQAEVVPGRWVKPGAVVIDVGINHKDGSPVGDVEFEEARRRASYITPVPGGIGPLTVTIMMKNLYAACQWQEENQ